MRSTCALGGWGLKGELHRPEDERGGGGGGEGGGAGAATRVENSRTGACCCSKNVDGGLVSWQIDFSLGNIWLM